MHVCEGAAHTQPAAVHSVLHAGKMAAVETWCPGDTTFPRIKQELKRWVQDKVVGAAERTPPAVRRRRRKRMKWQRIGMCQRRYIKKAGGKKETGKEKKVAG